MIITPINTNWGSKIEITAEEFFDQDINFWRNLSYEKKLLIFKKVEFTKKDYVNFGRRFGKLWNDKDYRYSRESADPVTIDNSVFFVSPFSNIISKRLVNQEMPWHADIPNRSHNPFPFRSLWITKNPNPKYSGKTSWLNLELAMQYLSEEELSFVSNSSVVQQSWYEPGTDVKELPMIKQHPITGNKSLRLNFFNDPEKNISNAWITGIKHNEQLQENCYFIRDLLLKLEKIPELVYEHTWDTFDIAIYDNWSFVHKRSHLIPNRNDPERHFFRINIDHCTNEEWNTSIL